MASVIFIAISLHVRFSSGVINIDLLFVLLVFFSCSFERWTKQILHAILRLKNYLFDTNVFQIILKSDLMVQFKISTFLSLGTGKTNGGKRKASERKRSESLKHIKKVRKTNCLKRIKNVQIGIWCLPVSPHGEFAPILTHLAIKCFKFIFLIPRKKSILCARWNKTCLFFIL